jgi:2'-5' RNA ligase
MAFIGIKLPQETGRLLNGIDVPGQKEAPGGMHITMIYLGNDVPMDVLSEIIRVTLDIAEKTQPFTVRTNRVTCFPKGEDGVPVICRVESDPLHVLRAKLCGAFDQEGLDYDKKFPDYKPHVTLSYASELIEERRIPTVEWGAHELMLWGGNSGDGRLTVTFPLSINAKMARRVVDRWKSEAR